LKGLTWRPSGRFFVIGNDNLFPLSSIGAAGTGPKDQATPYTKKFALAEG
jgi:hypothetical protein